MRNVLETELMNQESIIASCVGGGFRKRPWLDFQFSGLGNWKVKVLVIKSENPREGVWCGVRGKAGLGPC